MKVIIIQENGRHEENRNYRECFCIQKAFHRLGISADVWGLGHDNYHTPPEWDSYDLVVNLENYDKTDWLSNLATCKAVKFLWSIDAHTRGLEPYLHIFNKHKYDLILQATPEYLTDKSVWLPNAFDDTLIKPLNIKKEHYIGFCGNYVNRKEYIDLIDRNTRVKRDIFIIGDAMVRAINSYKIHFNKNISNDINYRNFETIGCNTLLLTSYNEHYNKLGFQSGVNCLIYKDLADLHNIITNPPENIQEISNNGFQLSKRHTYLNRAKSVIKLYNDISHHK